MEFELRQLNPIACRTYLVRAKDSQEVTLVDPVLDQVKDYIELLQKEGLSLTQVIDTHTHADHISGSSALRDITGCDHIMHSNSGGCRNKVVDDGDDLDLSGVPGKVMFTPGHTKDSVSLVLPGALLTGDALFLEDGGAGRDDLPGGDPGQHWETLERFKALDEDLIVYPAHEYRDKQPSSLANQKRTNPHMQDRTKQEFIDYINDLKLGPAEWMKDVLRANYTCAVDPGAAWIPADISACEVKGTLNVNEVDVGYISVDEFDSMDKEGSCLIDVREPAELRGSLGMIKGVKNIPVGSLSSRLDEVKGMGCGQVIAICRSGGRAYTAGQILKHAGIDTVVLEGGMLAYNAKNNS